MRGMLSRAYEAVKNGYDDSSTSSRDRRRLDNIDGALVPGFVQRFRRLLDGFAAVAKRRKQGLPETNLQQNQNQQGQA